MQYVLVILLLFTLGLLIFSLISPTSLSKFAKKEINRKQSVIGFGLIVIILFVLIGVTAPQRNQSNQPEVNNSEPKAQEIVASSSPTPSLEPSASPDYLEDYQVKVSRDRGNIINYKLLISPDDEIIAEDIATNFFKKCTKNCTVDVYDDEKALNLHEQYDQMYMKSETTQEDLKAWENKNYIYVADHYVGSINFDAEMYNDYPLKDWYYEELGGENK